MTARWTIHLRHGEEGWEWSKAMTSEYVHGPAWWGFYKTEGHAKSAAKRSVPKVIGKSNPSDFAFVIIGG
jgi:hypothetical protein